MFDFIRKAEFFDWWEAGLADRSARNLKSIQDAWILSQLGGSSGLRICEVGGGDSRVLRVLGKSNECWNVDRFEGHGNGPKEIPHIPGVKTVRAFLGQQSEELEDAYFDVVFSISVVEHVPTEDFPAFFEDTARILKPGGRLLHAIDLYVNDNPREHPRVELYRHAAESSGTSMRWAETPVVPERVSFSCAYATNSDHQLAAWNRVASKLRESRAVSQSCSLKAVWLKG